MVNGTGAVGIVGNFLKDLVSSWKGRNLLPALVFWGGGLLVWIWAYNCPHLGLNEVFQQSLLTTICLCGGAFNRLSPFGFLQGPLLAFLAPSWLLLFFLLMRLVDSMIFPLLRLCEGYDWPWIFAVFTKKRIEAIRKELEQDQREWIALANRFDILTVAERNKYNQIDEKFDSYPVNLELLLPTRLGNILRATEEYPERFYGLNIFVVLPRLLQVLPEDIRKEINETREQINQYIRQIIWGIFFFVWTLFSGWQVLIGLLIFIGILVLRLGRYLRRERFWPVLIIFLGFLSYWSVLAGLVSLVASIAICWAYKDLLSAAILYRDLVRSVFDMYRFKLYLMSHWTIPESPKVEKAHGQLFTRYLFRHSSDINQPFVRELPTEHEIRSSLAEEQKTKLPSPSEHKSQGAIQPLRKPRSLTRISTFLSSLSRIFRR